MAKPVVTLVWFATRDRDGMTQHGFRSTTRSAVNNVAGEVTLCRTYQDAGYTRDIDKALWVPDDSKSDCARRVHQLLTQRCGLEVIHRGAVPRGLPVTPDEQVRAGILDRFATRFRAMLDRPGAEPPPPSAATP